MKKNYDKSFSINISANTVADKLAESLNPKLSRDKVEKLVDTIVGPMVANDESTALKYLYFGLFDIDIEAPVFKESDMLSCSKEAYTYIESDEVKGEFKEEYKVIGSCKLIGFDTYRKNQQYQIEYSRLDRNGKSIDKTMWVNESDLNVMQA